MLEIIAHLHKKKSNGNFPLLKDDLLMYVRMAKSLFPC